MAIYELQDGGIKVVTETTFSGEQIRERGDLQRLLREQIEIVAPDTIVIAEEFGAWQDSRCRIDLLALDRDANLVVVELKRTEDGGHMELQAIRYAAMVSTMTFDQVVDAHVRFLERLGKEGDARQMILDFLKWEEPDEERFAQDVRLVLVSSDFGKELTTAVMWLNERDLDIRCIRVKPYNLDGRILLDVQQVIPLPEAAEYQVRVREKDQKWRGRKRQRKDLATIWRELEANRSEEEVRAARDIHEWMVPRVTQVFTTSNGFAPLVEANGRDQYFFKVMSNGFLAVWFQYLSNKEPFSNEAKRRELLTKLNQAPGIDIGEDRLRGKPKIPLSALAKPETMRLFKAAMQWAFDEVRRSPGRAEGESQGHEI